MQILSPCYSDTIIQPPTGRIGCAYLKMKIPKAPDRLYLLSRIEIAVSALRPQTGCRWIPEKLQKFRSLALVLLLLFPSNYPMYYLASSSCLLFLSFSSLSYPIRLSLCLSFPLPALSLVLDKRSTSLRQEYANILSKKSNELNFITPILLDAWTPSKTIYPKFVESWLFSTPVRELTRTSPRRLQLKLLRRERRRSSLNTFDLFQITLNLRKLFNFYKIIRNYFYVTF